MARSQIGDLADALKAFPNITYDEYMYERSVAQIQLMAADSSHTKYLKGGDKKIWEDHLQYLKSIRHLEYLLGGGNPENLKNIQ